MELGHRDYGVPIVITRSLRMQDGRERVGGGDGPPCHERNSEKSKFEFRGNLHLKLAFKVIM